MKRVWEWIRQRPVAQPTAAPAEQEKWLGDWRRGIVDAQIAFAQWMASRDQALTFALWQRAAMTVVEEQAKDLRLWQEWCLESLHDAETLRQENAELTQRQADTWNTQHRLN